jgi:hypothetical protein
VYLTLVSFSFAEGLGLAGITAGKHASNKALNAQCNVHARESS